MNGTYVKLEDTINWFEKILNGELDEVSEDFFMYKGTIEDVITASKKSKD
jgi:F-type H+-transporting ATPase subunit beta